MKIPRQARLESAILLALAEVDTDSIAALSRRVDASRPSTSRAFAALSRKGLVETTGRRRSLTQEGRRTAGELLTPSAAAQRLMDADQRKIQTIVERAQVRHFLGNTVMYDTVRRLEHNIHAMNKVAEGPTAALQLIGTTPMYDIAAKVAEMVKVTDLPGLTIGKRFAQMELDALSTIKVADIVTVLPDAGTRSLLNDIGQRFADMPIPKGVFADLEFGVGREAQKALARIGEPLAHRDLTDFVAQMSLLGRELSLAQVVDRGVGVAAAMDSIRLQMDALAPAMLARADWVPLITESVAVNSAIVRNVFAINEFAKATDFRLRKRHARVAAVMDPMVVANRDNTAAELGRLVSGSLDERAGLFISPSKATGRLAGVARSILDGQEPQTDVGLPDAGELLDFLDRRGMSAVSRDLRGARDALADLPDAWAKTAAHLLREAFREVLLVLAPDPEIPNPAKEQVTRRMRITYAIGSESETLATLVDSTATGWDGMVGFLSSEAHRDVDPRLNLAGMVGVLLAVEGMIRILIAAHDIGRHHTE